MLVLWFIGGIITYFILKYEYVMEFIGFAAVFIEAMLGVFTNLSVSFDRKKQKTGANPIRISN